MAPFSAVALEKIFKMLTEKRIFVTMASDSHLEQLTPTSAHLVSHLYQILYLRFEELPRNPQFRPFSIFKKALHNDLDLAII